MFLEFPFEYAVLPDIGKLFYPIVYLQLHTLLGWQNFVFLVDTGADVTTVSVNLLPVIGIKKNTLKKSSTMGVGGLECATWEFELPIKFGQKEFKIAASAVDTKDDSMPLLLGKKDIFEEKFSLTIDSKKKKTVIFEN